MLDLEKEGKSLLEQKLIKSFCNGILKFHLPLHAISSTLLLVEISQCDRYWKLTVKTFITAGVRFIIKLLVLRTCNLML